MVLSTDSQVLLLLCSRLGLALASDVAPLTAREWHALAAKMETSKPEQAGGLLGLGAADLQAAHALSSAEAERLARLLDRGGALAIALERLGSLGIWPLTIADAHYPQRLRQRLRESAPCVIFGAGEGALLGQPGLAVVGSRHVDESGKSIAEFAGNACAQCGLGVYSGGARGVDATALGAALGAGGKAVAILADSLERAIRVPEVRAALERDDLALVTPYTPDAGFSVGAAMGRNKLIYAMADYGLVIASDANKGGTWAGAIEVLKNRWVPLFVVSGPSLPEGNRLLIEKGARPFPVPFPEPPENLARWLSDRAASNQSEAVQPRLF